MGDFFGTRGRVRDATDGLDGDDTIGMYDCMDDDVCVIKSECVCVCVYSSMGAAAAAAAAAARSASSLALSAA